MFHLFQLVAHGHSIWGTCGMKVTHHGVRQREATLGHILEHLPMRIGFEFPKCTGHRALERSLAPGQNELGSSHDRQRTA
jgi:hypothetical protein